MFSFYQTQLIEIFALLVSGFGMRFWRSRFALDEFFIVQVRMLKLFKGIRESFFDIFQPKKTYQLPCFHIQADQECLHLHVASSYLYLL